jgi:broad specificity phosphatase PhoE
MESLARGAVCVGASSRYTPTMTRRVLLFAACAILSGSHAFAQSTVFLVRHAERADSGGGAPAVMAADPDLSATGHARAQSLAAMLRDARITTIFVTQYKRTQQTAAPLAKALGVTPTVITSKDLPGLVAKVREATGNVLVVGHSNSVPDLLKQLGVADAPAIADDEYDNLFIVTQPKQFIRLRFP